MRTLSIVFVVLAGCGSASGPANYAPPLRTAADVRAPQIEPMGGRPFLRDVTVEAAIAAQERSQVPKPVEQGATDPDPHLIVREANQDGYKTPADDCWMEGQTLVCPYNADSEYAIYTCVWEPVQIRLAPGERMVSDVKFGNWGNDKKPKWRADEVTAGDGHGHSIQVITLNPLKAAMPRHRAQIFTNIGPYTLELNVLPDDEKSCMRAVRWRHPERELRAAAAETEAYEARKERKAIESGGGCNSADYKFAVTEGSPRWVPTLVWRTCDGDHARVHIQFPKEVAWSKVPAFKLLPSEIVPWRYDPTTKVLTVDGLFSRGLLQLGSVEQGYEKVKIWREE